MRTVTFGGANSLDNYIARPDGSFDWIKWSREASEITGAFWKTIDTVVMGRKTFEVAVAMGNPAYAGMTNYVVSHTLKESPDSRVQVVKGDAVAFVAKLKRLAGKGICVMGGGVLAKSLLDADLIDEIGLNVHPVLLGTGVPLFYEMSRQINLELIACQQLQNGCVVLKYKVIHSKRKRGAR